MLRLILGLLLAAFCAAAAGGAASGRADLAVTAMTVSQHGASIRVTDTIRNVGTATAPPSSAAYYLGSRQISSRAVRRLVPQAGSSRTTSIVIAASIAPGLYRVRACADVPARIRERTEGNNCRFARGRIDVRDRTPPTFAGIVQATFCAPGPIGHDRTSRYFLKWDGARDAVTPTAAIVYDVYAATKPGGEDFVVPTYSTTAGATSFETPPLSTDTGRYFVVRARDLAGNRDRNTVERQAVSICV